MYLAQTTVGDRAAAEQLAHDLIQKHLACCVQIEGPVRSFYSWEGAVTSSEEFRLCIKCLESQLHPLEVFVLHNHPYSVPEWVVIKAEHVAEKYLSWAVSVSTSSTL